MKITIENTGTEITFVVNGRDVPARVWVGETEDGIPVHCFITRISPRIPESDPEIDTKTAQFDRELRRKARPEVEYGAIPLRFIL
jgi:hypothetical protein